MIFDLIEIRQNNRISNEIDRAAGIFESNQYAKIEFTLFSSVEFLIWSIFCSQCRVYFGLFIAFKQHKDYNVHASKSI